MPSDDDRPDLLAGLPRTRPQRRSAKRGPAAPRAPGRPPPRPSTRDPEPPEGAVEPPAGRQLVDAAVQAAGEVAHVGVSAARGALRAAVSRLPKP